MARFNSLTENSSRMHVFTEIYRVENSVDPDQMASSEAI